MSYPLLILLTVILGTVSHVATDIYVPSLPRITEALQTTREFVQLTLSAYLLGFGLLHLVFGPLSDRYGRRPIILYGIALSLIGTALCAFAPNIEWLLIGRFIQGAGLAAPSSLVRAVAKDSFETQMMAKFGSHVSMAIAVVLAVAPALGGYLQLYFDWRASFIFYLVYSSLSFVIVWHFLQETNLKLDPNATRLQTIAKNYWQIISCPFFLGYVMCALMSYGGIIAYATATPFIFQKILHLSPVENGWLMVVIAGALAFGGFINARLIGRMEIKYLMSIGILAMMSGGFLLLCSYYLNYLNTGILVATSALFVIGCGFTFANASAKAFHYFGHMAGSTAAIYGCLLVTGGTIVSAVMAKLPADNQAPLACVYIVVGLLAGIAFWLLAIPSERKMQNAQTNAQET